MSDESLPPMRNEDRAALSLPLALAGAVLGAGLGAGGYYFGKLPGFWQAVGKDAGIGILGGILLPWVWPWLRRAPWREWRVTEVKWQGATFNSNGAQRRAARRIFFEMATRITTRPMGDEEGDDGVALKSLYNFITFVRETLTAVDPAWGRPTHSVETYALLIINRDLAPFLSPWHAEWDAWHEANKEKHCRAWEKHREFRHDLRVLQVALRERALGLATIAGVPDARELLAPMP